MRSLLVIVFLLLSCGRDDSRTPPARDVAAEVSARVSSLRSWAPRCSNGMLTKEEQRPSNGDVSPTVKGSCDDGDFLLFAGLACLSGETAQCAYVKSSQDTSGRLWRSPLRVGKEAENAFSRDMSVGFLAYVAATKDSAALTRWVDHVRVNSGRLCPVASDNRCETTAGVRTLARLVARGIDSSVDWGDLPLLEREAFDAQLYGQARAGSLGYPMHLVAAQILVLEHLSLSGTYWIDQARAALWNRQPENVLFAHLARRDDVASELLLAQAPAERPARLRQWSFEREDSEEAWRESMGWEMITLGNLLTR